MTLPKNIQLIDLGLYLKKEKTLVVTDPHFGYEETLHRRGVMIPKFQFEGIKEHLEKIFTQISPETIVVSGDLKHAFGRIQSQEWDEVHRFIDFLNEHCSNLILVKGNHDIMLGSMTRRKKVQFEEIGVRIGNAYILHGHQILDNEEFNSAKQIIMGNEHPAIVLSDGVSSEKYKCFLSGTWEDKELFVLPSLNQATEGTDVLGGQFISVFLENGVDDFDVYIVAEDAVRHFGTVQNLAQQQV